MAIFSSICIGFFLCECAIRQMFECNLCIIIGELIWMDSDRLGTCTNE